ncbi:MAG TPA: PKD-like domain-containing protein [Mucilaginibacter sp.]|jgi:gliding motility-associated-like protein
MKTSLIICFFLFISLRGYPQACTLHLTISQSAQTICSGNSVTLTASTSGSAGPFTYAWNTGETTQSINVNKGGTYSVSVSDKTSGCQATKSITIAALLTPNAPSVSSVIVCPNSPATLKAIGPGGTYQWYDAAGNFLASGDTYTTNPITISTLFYVEATVSGCTGPRALVYAYVYAKPTVTGATMCGGNVATISANGGDSYTWYDAISGGNVVSTGQTFTTPVLNATQTYYVVAVTHGCVSEPTPVTVNVTPAPQTPIATSPSICAGQSANLHASGNGAVFYWYNVATGGSPLISSPDYTTPPLTTTTTYYVECASNNCLSPRTMVTVTVNPIPVAPIMQSDTVCYGTSTTLQINADPSVTYEWYDAATGGNLVARGASYSTPVLNSSTRYYVLANNGSCTSSRAPINVIVKPAPTTPSVSGSIICPGSVTTLTVASQAGNFLWYDAPTGGNLLSTGASFTTPALTANTTYYVQNVLSGCTGVRAAVTVQVLSIVPPPVVKNMSVCYSSLAVLIASGSTGNYYWYDSATGGNFLSSGNIYVTPPLMADVTFYVEAGVNGCTSARVPVTVTVNPLPSPIVVNGISVCDGASAGLTATGSGVIQWYDTPVGGNPLATGNTFNTPPLSANTSYFLQYAGEKCFCMRTPVTVTINPVAHPYFQYSSGTFCTSGENPNPFVNNPSGGTFSSSPAGLVFLNASTGQINVSASTPGNYIIALKSNNVCQITATVNISIASASNSDFTYNGPYCQNGVNPLPTFIASSTAGKFSATPAGLFFVNTSSGEIDLIKSMPGTYIVTNTINGGVGCPSSVSTASVTINQGINVSAGPSQSVLAGNPVQLAGTITGASSTGTWSGGTGSFSNPTDPNAVYTPGSGETAATLTLTANYPSGPCGPVSDHVTITFNLKLSAPIAPDVNVCIGSSAKLLAIRPGGYYEWYDQLIGGTLLGTGATFNTPPITVNTIYYVQTTGCGVTSARTAVTATPVPTPDAPIAPAQQICGGNTATLVASGSLGTYQWYDSAVGGNLLSMDSIYITPPLIKNTTYYVETIANGCVSARTNVDVKVTSIPNITSSPTDYVCSGNPLNYAITADLGTTTFSWTRAQVPGISNPAATNQTSNKITETLIDTSNIAVNVTYVIIPINGNCTGQAFNYVVAVYPTPVVTGPSKATLCNYYPDNYAITFNTSSTNFSWSRAPVAGIANAAVYGQTTPILNEVLFNSTNVPIDVNYVINYNTGTCPGVPFNFVLTVNPDVKVTSPATDTICSGSAQNYAITSNVPSATFTWSRKLTWGISNSPVSNQASDVINETLINTSIYTIKVIYTIIPTAFNCSGQPFTYTVTVNPTVPTPAANSNTPVCVGNIIHLATPIMPGASYLWTGPNGYTSTTQNPDITNVSAANAGTYTLVAIINGCSSQPVNITVAVNALPTAAAGPNQTVCVSAQAVSLAGNVTGGTTTGVWTTAGTGTFSPSNNVLDAQYIPSNADKVAGLVKITLSSTSKDDCNISSSDMTIAFGPIPSVIAGKDQDVCSQSNIVKLNGEILIPGSCLWSTSGTGTFSPSNSQLKTDYIPTAADIQQGSVILTLLAVGADSCYMPTDNLKIKFIPPPTVNAGGTRYVLHDRTITLHPVVSDDTVQYLWSPNVEIKDVTAKNPVVTGDVDRTYTLTVTDSRGCVSQSETLVKVSPKISIDNTFTPNGDGVNDVWNITGLIAYTDATVDIFTRYGQKVFHSLGYPKAWDGTYNAQPVPVGVYYYVIDTKANDQVLSGYVTVIR